MSQTPADRNLLFGVLALQMDFITREALIAATSAWVLDKARPLDQILLERGDLARDAHAALEVLIRQHLKAHGDDPARSLAAVSSADSIRRDLARVADPDVRASLAAASSPPAASSPRPSREPVDTNATVGDGPDAWNPRFRILRPHAKGGLGE